MKFKKNSTLKKHLLYVFIFLLFGLQNNRANNLIPFDDSLPLAKETKVRVVFIFYNKILNKKGEFNGEYFDTFEKVLVGIIKYSYFDKSDNVQRFKRTYNNHELHPGFVIGHPDITGNGIYVEPKNGDKLQIYARTDSRGIKVRSPRIPFNCEKKGTRCVTKTDKGSKFNLTVIEDRWNSNNGYSTLSTYKINSIFLLKSNKYTQKITFNKLLSSRARYTGKR